MLQEAEAIASRVVDAARRSRAEARRDDGREALAMHKVRAEQPTESSFSLAMEPDVRDRSALLTVLTTEHFTLQGSRSGTITESLGRTTIYLGSLSASLVALALVFRGGTAMDDFRLFALVVLPALVFLGTVTFVRVLETGIEDAIYG